MKYLLYVIALLILMHFSLDAVGISTPVTEFPQPKGKPILDYYVFILACR